MHCTCKGLAGQGSTMWCILGHGNFTTMMCPVNACPWASQFCQHMDCTCKGLAGQDSTMWCILGHGNLTTMMCPVNACPWASQVCQQCFMWNMPLQRYCRCGLARVLPDLTAGGSGARSGSARPPPVKLPPTYKQQSEPYTHLHEAFGWVVKPSSRSAGTG